MKALTGEHEDTEAGEDLSYQALKTNAMFLANKATGADNKEAAAEPAALAAAKELAAFNPNDVAFPVDQYYWKAATIPGGAAYSADLEHPSALPEPVKITHVKNNKGGVDQAQLDAIGTAVVSAKAELSALGAKSKGIVKKKEVPRNRALAGTFVADTYLVGAGGVRAGASAAALQNLTEIVSLAAGGGLKPEKAAAAIPAARFVKSYVEILELQLKQYTGALRDDAKAVSKIRKYGQRTQLSKTLNDVATYTDQTVFTRFLNDVKKSDPQALLDSLTEAAKPKAPPVPSREGRPALSGSGRKPLIGSRGKR
jgi:hypothetical protein